MIPEQREHDEHFDFSNKKPASSNALHNALEEIMRKTFSYEQLASDEAKAAAVDYLSAEASSYAHAHNMRITPAECNKYAKDAVSCYLDNWKNKTPGEDDRGHRLGKDNTKGLNKNVACALSSEI